MSEQTGTTVEEKVVVTLESLGLVPGGRYTINGLVRNGKTILENRSVQLTKASKKTGVVNGQLFHEKTGLLQKCEITVPVVNVAPYVAPVVEPATEVTDEVASEQAVV